MKVSQKILNVVAIGTIVILPHLELLPFFGYSIPVLLLTWFALKHTKETFSDIGFSHRQFKPKALLTGGLVAILTLAFMQLVFHPVLGLFVSLEYQDAGLNDTIQTGTLQYILMVYALVGVLHQLFGKLIILPLMLHFVVQGKEI